MIRGIHWWVISTLLPLNLEAGHFMFDTTTPPKISDVDGFKRQVGMSISCH